MQEKSFQIIRNLSQKPVHSFKMGGKFTDEVNLTLQ